MESSSADIKYPLPSYLRRRQRDTQTYNQESDCPLHYRRHHSWGEQKQKLYTRIPRHICRRSSHTDILRPPHQRPHHYHNHLQDQQHQQNNTNSIPTTATTTTTNNNNNNNNNNGSRKNETISSHNIKYIEQTRQQSVTTNCGSETKASTLQSTLIRIGSSGLAHWIPVQCRVDIHPDYRNKPINQESTLYLTKPRLTLSRLRRQFSDPGTHPQQQQQQQHETYSCNDHPVYFRLVPRKLSGENSNLSTQKQSKLKDKHFTLGACPLKWQSQSICDCPRGGLDDPKGFCFPGRINLEKTQGSGSGTIGINDEDKETLDQDLVMGEKETALLPWRKIRDQIVSRQGYPDRKEYPIIENGGGEIKTVELAASAHQVAGEKFTGDLRNTNGNSNAYKTRPEKENCRTMSSISRGEVIKENKLTYRHTVLNINTKSRAAFQRNICQRDNDDTNNKVIPGIDTITNIRNNHKPNIKTITNARKNINSASETRKNTIDKTESNLCTYNVGRSFAGFNITCLRFFLFILIGCALQGTLPGGIGSSHASWPFPGADAKAVVSLSKNVLMTDADHKQVSSIGKIDPPSESIQEEQSFDDFPDVDSEKSVAGGIASDEDQRNVGDKKNSDENDDDPKSTSKNIDEYEAYDDSTGQDTEETTKDSNPKQKTPQNENPDQNINDVSDVGDEEIADSIDEEEEEEEEDEDEDDDDDDDEDEDWAGDMSSQPLFVRPGMDVDGSQGGMGTTGKHSSESATLEDKSLKREIPEYMLKLYRKFTEKHYIHPASDTVRSFSNINDDILFNISNGSELPGAKTRNHTLIFNISSFPRGEQINLAHLRLYKLVERDRNTYVGDDRKVSLYEVITQDDGSRHLKLVSQKHIYGRNSGWESFDVTPAVRRWVAEIESGTVQMLEVTIESIFNSVWGNDVDISTEPRNKKEPLLVVFSKQINKRLVHQQERDELLQHDMTLSDIEDVDNYTTTEPPLSSTSSNGNDSDDEQEDDEEDEDASKEDSYGSIDEMTSYAKVTQSMRTGKEYLSRSKQKVRVKRSKTSSKRNICRRTKLEVDFRDIQGHGWIVAPKKYQAFECSGKCYFPLGDHLRPTKHAIIRANLHIHNKKVTRPCCVPTKLDSISLLYLDSKTNGYTFKYNFEGMKVVECGCR